MNLSAYLYYRALLFKKRALRYRALFETIYKRKCRRLVEIGTYDGVQARHMIRTAMNHHNRGDIEYFGFDLFENLTDEKFEAEPSKRAPTMQEVEGRLRPMGANIRLFAGETAETLPRAVGEIGRADFIFIDGGHSFETISSDWKYTEELMGPGSVAIFDDYYTEPDEAIAGMGCQETVDAIDRARYHVEVLPIENTFRKEWGALRIRMARVTKR